ncbi:MAG: tetratricopeptide repeat protein [Phycisphaerales bacterium]|nr:tetratricopeptide repeat protein [Phycisphaerales bacterium]
MSRTTPHGSCLHRLSALLLTGAVLISLCGCIALRGGPRTVAMAEIRDGQQLAEAGLTAEALAAFERAIELSPRMPAAHIGAARVLQMRGDYEAAEVAYSQAADLQPSNFDAHFGQGLMLQLLDRLSEAVRAYLRAVQLRPNSAPTHLNLAMVYLQLGEPRQAVAFAEQAVALDPGNGASHANLGAIYTALDRHDEALYEYEAAVRIIGSDIELLRNMADTQGWLKHYDDMQLTLVKLIRAKPDARAYERLGYARFKTRRYTGALAAFEQSLRFDADYIPALNGVGVCLLNRWLLSDRQDTDAHQRGIESLRGSVRLNNDQPQILDLLHRYAQP